MAFFIPGAAIGGPTPVGWFWGGVTAVGAVFSGIVIFFGIQLAWSATITEKDIEKGFRAAVAKEAENNPDIAQAIETAQDDEITFEDIGDLAEFDDDEED